MRLFFALRPDADQCVALLAQTAPLLATQDIALVPPTNLHATLCFLGAVPKDRLPALRDAASRVRSPCVSLSFDALEYWAKPKILCVTAPEQGSTSAAMLAKAIADEVVAAGFSPDIKPFRAHLTLARKVKADRAAALELPQSLQPGFVVRCAEFALMESRRGERGSIYSVLNSWPLDGMTSL
jgi:RNA 2',3'-cyclic 3'-phosphodiesterase